MQNAQYTLRVAQYTLMVEVLVSYKVLPSQVSQMHITANLGWSLCGNDKGYIIPCSTVMVLHMFNSRMPMEPCNTDACNSCCNALHHNLVLANRMHWAF